MDRIVSHLAPRHMDDWLAICLVKALYPKAQIEYVHPQSVPEEYIKSKDICLIDVGMSYDPEVNNYDHHHNLEIPSSVILVIKHFTPEVDMNARFLKAIDIIDRFGFKSALKQGLVREDKDSDEKRKVILLTEITENIASIVSKAVKFAGKMNSSYEDFMTFLYALLSETVELKSAKEKLEREKQEFERKLKGLRVFDLQGIKVGLSTESLAPYHYMVFEKGIDLLVERNSMNKDHTSLIVNTASPNKDKAYELREMLIKDLPVVFRHQNGFIVVVDRNVEDINLMEVYTC